MRAVCAACGPSPDAGGGAVWRSSRAPDRPCGGCGAAVAADGYCGSCGRRPGVGSDHAEHELPGVAAVTDRGPRRHRNEDAYAIGVVDGRRAAVVCDGVSSVPGSDRAATAAVGHAIAVLVAGGTLVEAYRSAAAALADGPTPDPPSCTFLAAVVEHGTITVGWLGDSRAYWLDAAGARCLTVDDSLAGQLTAAGVDVDGLPLPAQATALTRWLGADAPAGDPHLTALRPAGPGVLLLSSDGLTRYPAWTAAVAGAGCAGDLARRLTAYACAAGGADNVTVAVVPVDPGPSTASPAPRPTHRRKSP